jgi:hypothetical protein
MACDDFRLRMAGFGLTTANILYHLPDHPGILQSFIWQRSAANSGSIDPGARAQARSARRSRFTRRALA